MAVGIVPALLLLVTLVSVTSVKAQCRETDIHSRLKECIKVAEPAVKSGDCSELITVSWLTKNCFVGCQEKQIPTEYVKELDKLELWLEKEIATNCNKSENHIGNRNHMRKRRQLFPTLPSIPGIPSIPGGGVPTIPGLPSVPGLDCAAQILNLQRCTSGLTNIANLPDTADFTTLKNTCGTIDDVAQPLTDCGQILNACSSVLLSGNTVAQSTISTAYNGVSKGQELSNGGCQCVNDVTGVADNLASAPSFPCGVATSLGTGVNALMGQCVDSANQAVQFPSFDWAQRTRDYVGQVNPVVTQACNVLGLLTGTGAAPTLNLSLSVSLAAALLFLMRTLW